MKDNKNKVLSEKITRKSSEEYIKKQIEKAYKELEKYLESVSESYESLAKKGNTYARKLNKTLKKDLKKVRKYLKFFKGSNHLVKGLNYADLAKEIQKDYDKYGLPKTLGIHGPAEGLGHIGGPLTRIATIPAQEALKDWTRDMDSWGEVWDSIKQMRHNIAKTVEGLEVDFGRIQNTIKDTSNDLNNAIDTEEFNGTLEIFEKQLTKVPTELKNIKEYVEAQNAAEEARKKAEEYGYNPDDLPEDIKYEYYEHEEVYGEIIEQNTEDNSDEGGFVSYEKLYSSGGIIPGNPSQTVPITAHGSEIILNPSQQASLFNQLNTQKDFGSNENFIYSPVIEAGNSVYELINQLQKHSLLFISEINKKAVRNT